MYKTCNCITGIRLIKTILNARKITVSAPHTQKDMEELQKNPYFLKYTKKIETLQKTDPTEFQNRVESTLKIKSKVCERVQPTNFSLLHPKNQIETTKSVQLDNTLDKIMKIDLIKDKNVTEIKEIWENYHIQKDVLSATIPVKDYDCMMSRAEKHPMFIFPLPRSQGYEFMLSQFSVNTVHFTPLICYQVHKENAPECLTLYHYTDLQEKGIVLMRGEYDKNVINSREAQCLANQLQLYYTQEDSEKMHLLESFTMKPDSFKHTDLINQIECLSLN